MGVVSIIVKQQSLLMWPGQKLGSLSFIYATFSHNHGLPTPFSDSRLEAMVAGEQMQISNNLSTQFNKIYNKIVIVFRYFNVESHIINLIIFTCKCHSFGLSSHFILKGFDVWIIKCQ